MVAGHGVLDDAGEHVADMGLAVGRRRAVIEDVAILPVVDFFALLENVLVFPELQDLLFPLGKALVLPGFPIHTRLSFT